MQNHQKNGSKIDVYEYPACTADGVVSSFSFRNSSGTQWNTCSTGRVCGVCEVSKQPGEIGAQTHRAVWRIY